MEIKYTQEQIDNRTSDYVCFDCGRPFIQGLEDRSGVSTFHNSECGLCGEVNGVTHIRNWDWLRLTKRKKTSLENKE